MYMYKENTIKSIVRCVSVVLLVCFFTLAQGSDIDLCDFNGFINGPGQWEKIEFSNLLKNDEMPGYHLMVAIIGKIAVTDNSVLKSPSCKISKYVAELIRFYDKNEVTIRKKHEDTADLLDYIKTNLRDE